MTTIRGDHRHTAVRQINQVLFEIHLNYTRTRRQEHTPFPALDIKDETEKTPMMNSLSIIFIFWVLRCSSVTTVNGNNLV